jgi:hypothetical protein
VTREELWQRVHAVRDAFYAGDPLYEAATPEPAEPEPEPESVCDVCAGGGTVMVAVGPLDEFGVPDGTVEAPCPVCAAGDAEAQHRIGRSWRTTPDGPTRRKEPSS